jgi:hypothetical protein
MLVREGLPRLAEEGHPLLGRLVIPHELIDHDLDIAAVAQGAKVHLLDQGDQLVVLAGPLGRVLHLVEAAGHQVRLLLEQGAIVGQGGRGITRLDELRGELELEPGVVGAELRHGLDHPLDLVALAGRSIVRRERLVELHRLRRACDLGLGPLDQLLELARPREHLDRLTVSDVLSVDRGAARCLR